MQLQNIKLFQQVLASETLISRTMVLCKQLSSWKKNCQFYQCNFPHVKIFKFTNTFTSQIQINSITFIPKQHISSAAVEQCPVYIPVDQVLQFLHGLRLTVSATSQYLPAVIHPDDSICCVYEEATAKKTGQVDKKEVRLEMGAKKAQEELCFHCWGISNYFSAFSCGSCVHILLWICCTINMESFRLFHRTWRNHPSLDTERPYVASHLPLRANSIDLMAVVLLVPVVTLKDATSS